MMCKIEERTEAENRQTIIENLSDNVFVEAGAGAGKTTLIVTRIVNQLKQGMAPEGIVVITFTNAAAEELRSRITRKVREASEDKSLLEQERSYLQKALQELDLMQISTIHSFCFTLLKERIFDAKLPMDVSLMEEAEKVAQAKRIFTEWASQLSKEDWETLSVCADKKSEVLRKMGTLFESICDLPEDTQVYYDKSVLAKDYQEAAKMLVLDFEKLFCGQAGLLLGKTITKPEEIPEHILMAEAKKLRTLLLKEEVPYLEALDIIGAAPTGKSDNSKKYFKAKKEEMAQGANLLQIDIGCREWYEKNHTIEVDLLRRQYKEQKYALLVKYAVAAQEYYRQNRPLRKVSNDDLLQKTHHLICQSEEAREYFAKKIACLYVDEFQDTDHIQEEFIWKLCATKEDETKLRDGVLFLVGDPKQSIYRFRGAEPEVYFHAREKMQKLSNAKVYHLNNNYRSNEKMIAWINDSFRNQNLSQNEPYRDMICNRTLPEVLDKDVLAGVYYYTVPNFVAVNLEDDAVRLAELIDRLVDAAKITDYDEALNPYIRTIKYADFLVLCYSKEEMDVYLKEMQKRGIPVQINGSVSLKQNQVIDNFVRLYDSLLHKRDAAKEEGAIEALSESGIEEAAKVLSELRTEVKGMSAFGIAETLVEKWELLLPKDIEIRAEVMYSIQSKVKQMLETVFTASTEDYDSITELFWNYRANNLERELPLEEDSQAVRFMNLHKAKGLEGNIVILAKRNESMGFREGVYRKGNQYNPVIKGAYGRMEWTSYKNVPAIYNAAEQEELEEQTRLQYVAATRAKQALIAMDAINEGCMFYAQDYWANVYSEDNEERSILSVLNKLMQKTKTKATVKDYKSVVQKVQLEEMEAGERPDAPVYRKYRPSDFEQKSVTKQKIKEEKEKTGITCSKRPRGNIFGTAMHRGLELLVERWRSDFKKEPEQLAKVIRTSVNQAVFEGREEIPKSEVEAYKAFLEEILTSFAEWAYEEKLFCKEAVAEVYTEYAFSFADEAIGIGDEDGEVWLNGTADLMLRDKQGQITILDYKSDRDDYLTEEEFVITLREKYQGQLALYKKAMARLFSASEADIQLGLISFTEKESQGKVKVRYTRM